MNIYFLIAAFVALSAIAFFIFVLWLIMLGLKDEVEILEHQIKDKAGKWELEWADKKLREHDDKVEALEAHLGIRFVENPKRLVVKKTLEK